MPTKLLPAPSYRHLLEKIKEIKIKLANMEDIDPNLVLVEGGAGPLLTVLVTRAGADPRGGNRGPIPPPPLPRILNFERSHTQNPQVTQLYNC